MNHRVLPNQVFTPRRSEVNNEMYIDRSLLEDELIDAIYGSNHILIHGESGTGKSWLYKYTFHDQDIPYTVANLSNASRLGGIDAEFDNLVNTDISVQKTEYIEEKSAGLSCGVGSGKLVHKAKYEILTKEPFEQCLEILFNKANGKVSCLVFDNFEQILDQPDIVREIANCIILLDDDRYAKYNVKIVIVGVPNGIERYFSMQPNVATIINRITELPEVTGFTKEEARRFPKKGFKEILGYYCSDYATLGERIAYVTNRIPQQLHELCYSIAMQLERLGEKEITNAHLINGANKWFKQSLSGSFTSINAILNFDEDTNNKTRVLYAIGRYDSDEINPSHVASLLAVHFPKFTDSLQCINSGKSIDDVIDIEDILKTISKEKNPIIRLTPNGKTYRFVRPQYQMSLRIMLELDQEELVRLVDKEVLLNNLSQPIA